MDPLQFNELADTYTHNKQWGELIALLLDQVDQVGEKEGVPLLRRVAQILERERDDLDNAFDVLLTAAKIDYRDHDTAAELERVTIAANKWAKLLQHYTAELNSIKDDKATSIAIASKIAKWYGEHFKQVDFSIAYYNYVLDLDASNLEALKALLNIYTARGELENVAKYTKALGELQTT
jgi:hypothetical protein